jgi:PAS domain S-box-containing protein
MNKLLSLPIRQQILVLIVSMMVAPIVLTIYSAMNQRTKDIQEAHLLVARLANQINNDQNSMLIGAEQLLSTLSHIPSVEKHETAATGKILAELIRINPQYSNLLIADSDGTLWASAIPSQGAINYSDRRYFKNALSSGSFSSGEFGISRTINKPIMNFGYPVKDSSGKITDVAIAAFTPENYSTQFKIDRLPVRTSLILTDHKGTIIFSLTNPELIGTQDRNDLFRQMSEGPEEGSIEGYSNNNIHRYFAYRKLRLGNEKVPYMYVRTGIPVDVVLKKSTSQIIVSVGIMTVIMLLSLSVAFYITRRGIIDKIIALRNATQKVALGHLDIRVSDQVVGGELGELGESFEHMARRLSEEMETVNRSIEQRVQAEAALQESRQQLLDIIDFLPDATFVVDNKNRIIAWNRAMEEMTGTRKEEIIGQGDYAHTIPFYGERRPHLLDLLDVEDEELKARYSNVTRKGTTLFAETYTPALYGGKGAYIWAMGAPLFDAGGNRTGGIESLRDLTEKKQAEDQRNNDLALIESILQSSPAGIRVFDAVSGQCVLVNQSAADIAGGPREALLLQNFRLLESWKVSGLTATAEQVLSDGKTRSFEAVLNSSFGKLVAATYQLSSFTACGRLNLLIIGRDITEEKKLAADKEKIEQQLLHAQKLESLGVLAGGIAHDFNNILTAIIGNADLALKRLNPESPAVDNLYNITKSAFRAADLAKQMLAYSGKGRFVIESLDLNMLLEEMLHMLEVSISKKAVLRLNLHKPLPSVEADATQMRQIVMNLVINASEAIGERSGVIALTTGCMECDRSYLKDVWLDEKLTDGLYVYVEIADTGCGMDRDTLAKLFDPFFTTKFTGRGLGMAAVLGIVRGHKGAIKVYSEPGKGTTFKMLLPASNRPAELFKYETHSDDWKGSGTVLLVDDEESIRDIGSEMLNELGFTTITADDGREAVKVFRQNPGIVFVLMDLTMPHMDGEECFRELRKLNPAVKVIMSSGYNEQEVTQKFVGKGLAGFIQKPYKLSVLKETIKTLNSTD